MSDLLLDVHGMSLAAGGVQILRGVDFRVAEGEMVGILGPNGAGKTTLLNAITGFIKPQRGTASFLGRSIAGLRPQCITRRGLVRTFQNAGGFSDLTVEENLLLATRGHKDDFYDGIVRRLSLGDVLNVRVAEATLATRKLVGIALAVLNHPRVLLLDEPLSGLDPQDRDAVVDVIERVHADGVSIAMVEHDIGRTLALVHRLVVLDVGKQVADGTPADLSDDPALANVYMRA